MAQKTMNCLNKKKSHNIGNTNTSLNHIDVVTSRLKWQVKINRDSMLNQQSSISCHVLHALSAEFHFLLCVRLFVLAGKIT